MTRRAILVGCNGRSERTEGRGLDRRDEAYGGPKSLRGGDTSWTACVAASGGSLMQ